MIRVGSLITLQAEPGQEDAVADFLRGALALAEQELATITWYATRLGPATFGIFDTFPDDAGRQAHLAGRIAAALMAKAPQMLAEPPSVQKLDVLAAKTPG